MLFLLFLFDIAPDKPQLVGVTGIGGAVGLGLILTGIAVASIFLLRKNLPIAARITIAAVLLLIAAGSFVFAGFAIFNDATAESRYQEEIRRNNEARRRMQEERMRRERERQSQIPANSATNTNSR